MKKTPVHVRHLISIHRPELWIASAVAFLMVLMFIIWLAFGFGQQSAGFNQSETEQYVSELKQKIDQLTEQKNALHRENSKLTLGHSIDKGASSKMNKTMEGAQAKIIAMEEELLFYRNVMSPSKTTRSVEIKALQLSTAAKQNEFKYKLQLIQNGRHDVVTRGVVEISVEGENSEGKTIRLAMSTITNSKDYKKPRFGFKYFQNFDGGIRIPDGFVPKLMFIRVLPSSSKVPRIDKSFVWADILNVGDQDHVGQIEN